MSKGENTLDFICVGAAKSATSTLFSLLKGHPEIFIPPEKEVPYFNDLELIKKGWDNYYDDNFNDAPKKSIKGTLTPQYMSGTRVFSPEETATKIHERLPKTKIIVILRHPIDRSYSQYKMHRRFGYIKDSFQHASNRLLKKSKKELDIERKHLDPRINIFFFASEYGRILKKYYELFPRKNIKIIFTDDLRNSPKRTIESIFRFLSVDTKYTPKNINRRDHKGGGKPKVKFLSPAFVNNHTLVRSVWLNLVPQKTRKKIFMQISRWNIRPDNETLDKDSKLYKDLLAYYKKDVKKLEKLINKKVPWKDLR